MAVLGEYHASNDAPGPRVAAKSWHRGNASAVRANREQWGETSRFSEGLFPDRYGSCRTSAGAETCLWRWHDQSFPPLPKRLSKVCGTCSPFQAESVRRSSRSDVCSARSASLARYRSCRAERCERSDRVLSGVRSGVETSLRTWRDRSGFLVFREVSPRRRSSAAALVEATCIHSDVPPPRSPPAPGHSVPGCTSPPSAADRRSTPLASVTAGPVRRRPEGASGRGGLSPSGRHPGNGESVRRTPPPRAGETQ